MNHRRADTELIGKSGRRAAEPGAAANFVGLSSAELASILALDPRGQPLVSAAQRGVLEVFWSVVAAIGIAVGHHISLGRGPRNASATTEWTLRTLERPAVYRFTTMNPDFAIFCGLIRPVREARTRPRARTGQACRFAGRRRRISNCAHSRAPVGRASPSPDL